MLSLSVGANITRTWRTSLRAQIYDEDRTNGTPLQDNDTNQRQASVDVNGAGAWGDLRIRGFAAGQGYDQAFSAVNATRTAETLSSRQRVGATVGGASAEYVRSLGRVVLLAGGDARRVEGDMIERRPVGRPDPRRWPAGHARRLRPGHLGRHVADSSWWAACAPTPSTSTPPRAARATSTRSRRRARSPGRRRTR